MKCLWCILLFASMASAADWTGATWTRIGSCQNGYYVRYSRGLNCRGDTIFLMTGMSDYHFALYRWAPQMDSVESMPLPELSINAEMGFDSVDHVLPAIMDNNAAMLWHYRMPRWEPQSLRANNTDSLLNHVDGFCYDSTGALHYEWFRRGDFWPPDSVHYSRRGGGQPDRDTVFYSQVGTDGFSGLNGIVMCPTANSVFLAAEAANSIDWGITGYSLYLSGGGQPFNFHPINIGSCGGFHFVANDRYGNWTFAYLAGRNFRVIGGHATDILYSANLFSASGPFPDCRLTANPVDSTFEFANFEGYAGSYSVAVYRYLWDSMLWEQQLNCATPTTMRSMHLMIDHEGYGHLFALDSTTIWHYGHLGLSAHEPSIPAPQRLAIAVSPNPFNATTTLKFSLPTASRVTFQVWDVLGRMAFEQDLGMVIAGEHKQVFDGSNLSSGIYFAQVVTPQQTKTVKLALVK
jgi:hypothetical protein